MAFSFNAICCMLPVLGAAELEIAGVLMARVVKNAIQCPRCGVKYSLIVPASASRRELDAAAEALHIQLRSTCGDHPPIVQKP